MRILIVEDDAMLSDGLQVGLRLAGFSPEAVETCDDARHAMALDRFDALVLDLMLPDGSGLELLRELRGDGSDIPVLMLTARDRLDDRVAGLDAGADDYVGKPFELPELSARLRALVRRAQGRAENLLEWNGLQLDVARMTGALDGRALSFSRREFSILAALMERPGAILGKQMLEERLYGWQEDVESNTVEVHVHHLRAKLGSGFIQTVRGAGYRLAPEAEARRA
ncbi:MAG: DNA-binding response regulator [Rhodobacteraceae bacterium]|jgi:two-component system response regulator QseB|uniref:response regulator n=1 Tax=Salipiger profundus TaxID=1229727 RepID=UPI0002EE656B|nr:response regulator [Salipiger profundus]MAB04762.1 DNA-binding response regulator [Paracoccaceae bacterium]SFD19098.1 transcriptional regulator, winged helix family [Salipiger profundus]